MRALVIAMGLLLSLAGPVAADEDRPFQGSLAGVVTVTPLDPPIASVLIEASGTATMLGSFTVVIPHVVNQAARWRRRPVEASNGATPPRA
jgi:hypothetical protein